jgi:hypothetical protein
MRHPIFFILICAAVLAPAMAAFPALAQTEAGTATLSAQIWTAERIAGALGSAVALLLIFTTWWRYRSVVKMGTVYYYSSRYSAQD